MTTRLHRLWVPGAPQRRVFLPNFWMKLVKPEEPIKLPPNVLLFHVSPQMSQWDVEEYLTKVYQLDTVRDVRCQLVMGKKHRMKADMKFVYDKDEDHKEAFVTLREDQSFVFPDFSRDEVADNERRYAKRQKMVEEKRLNKSQSDLGRPGPPSFLPL